MDPVFKIPASPGLPLFPVSPERANRQALSHSPSLPSNLQDPFKVAQSQENSDVKSKVAQFNTLSKEAVQRRKDNEAAMRRAVLGREEAENETRRLKDENRGLRKDLEDGRARETRVAERIESVMVCHRKLTRLLSVLIAYRKSCIGPKRPRHMHKASTKRKFEERARKPSSHRALW